MSKRRKAYFLSLSTFFFTLPPSYRLRTELELYLLSFIYSLDNAETQTHDDN